MTYTIWTAMNVTRVKDASGEAVAEFPFNAKGRVALMYWLRGAAEHRSAQHRVYDGDKGEWLLGDLADLIA